LNKIIVDIYNSHPDHFVSREKFHFHLIRLVRNFPRQLQLTPFGVNIPLLFPVPHIYVPTSVSPADSRSIASRAPDMVQTCAGLTSISAGPSTSKSTLAQNHRSAFPHFPTFFLSHSGCKIPSSSTPAFSQAYLFQPTQHYPPLSRFAFTRTATYIMPLAKRNS